MDTFHTRTHHTRVALGERRDPEALPFLGTRRELPNSMHELVIWLKMHRSNALTELAELGQVVDEVASALKGLEAATRTLSESLASAASVLNGSAPAINLARTQANEVHDLAQVLRDTIEELQAGFAGALGDRTGHDGP